MTSNRSIAPCRFSRIQPLRALFLQELNAQVRYDAAHTRRGAAWYAIEESGRDIGYGALKDTEAKRGTVFEFYIVPAFRRDALAQLRALIEISKADAVECQTNDRLYAALVQELSSSVTSDTILFAPGEPNGLTSAEGVFRRRGRRDRIFHHEMEPVGDFVIDVRGDVVATGGFLLHYNPPFADIYMEVRGDMRRRGFGSFLVQQIVVECYLAGRVPAARTSVDNAASRATLLRAGLVECGRMLRVSVD